MIVDFFVPQQVIGQVFLSFDGIFMTGVSINGHCIKLAELEYRDFAQIFVPETDPGI